MSYPPFQGGPGYPPYPPQPGFSNSTPYPPTLSYPYPPQQPGGSPYPQTSAPYPGAPAPYPPAQGNSSYPPAYPPAPGAPSYPPSHGAPSYPPAHGTPSYPPAHGAPSYPPAHGTPSYPPAHGAPSYPPAHGAPSYPPAHGTPSYPPAHMYPDASYPPYHSSGYPSLGCESSLSHGSCPAQSYYQGSPTIRPFPSFNPRADAEVLRKAMKGIGTDEAAIISVLSKRTNAQRLEISREFKTLYGKDLLKDLKSETSGKFEDLIVALMTPLYEYYAKEVHHAISGVGTNESTLIEVLCTLSNTELHYVKMAYEKEYKNSMEKDLANDTSGHFKRLLVSLCCARREEGNTVNMAAAEHDAQALHQAGELKWGTDESTFNAVLSSRSPAQLQATFAHYERIAGHPLEKAIKSEFSGDIEDGLLAVVKCVQNKAKYLAERLHKSMAGAGTNDRALIRIIVTRSEIDLQDIKQEFQKKYGKSLESFIKEDTSGDYKKLLVALLG